MLTHVSHGELIHRLAEAATKVAVGGVYTHFKNPDIQYVVKSFGILEETEEVSVIYEAKDGEKIPFIRPLVSWLDVVEWEGKSVPRFAKV